MSDKLVGITVNVPDGKYCAKFFDWGEQSRKLGESDDQFVDHITLTEECPLLKRCEAHGERSLNAKLNSYYCPIANSDTHCGQDAIGVLKQDDYYDSICPSLYGDKIMSLLSQLSKLEQEHK